MNESSVSNPQKPVSIELWLKSWKIAYNFNQPYLIRDLNLSHDSNSFGLMFNFLKFQYFQLCLAHSFWKSKKIVSIKHFQGINHQINVLMHHLEFKMPIFKNVFIDPFIWQVHDVQRVVQFSAVQSANFILLFLGLFPL